MNFVWQLSKAMLIFMVLIAIMSMAVVRFAWAVAGPDVKHKDANKKDAS